MLIEAIKKLEAAGFVASYTMNSVKFAKSGGEVEAEINADAPIKSWANSPVLRALSGVGKHGVEVFVELTSKDKLKMPDLSAWRHYSFYKDRPNCDDWQAGGFCAAARNWYEP